MKLDNLDKEILALLSIDVRMSNAQLARAVGAGERTVLNRVNKLISNGVVSTRGLINSEHFGYHVIADIFCEVETVKIVEIAKEIAEFSEVSYVAISFGNQDISVQVITKSTDELFDFVKDKISQIPGVIKTNTVIVPVVIKDFNEWLPPELETLRETFYKEYTDANIAKEPG
jgi:Lrp/AsnC family transcriptional regulator for asnA, asnC and gidA